MSEFDGLQKHEKTKHALVGLGSTCLAAAIALPLYPVFIACQAIWVSVVVCLFNVWCQLFEPNYFPWFVDYTNLSEVINLT